MRPQNRVANTFDYIIVGAGTAGCALAARLSEDDRSSVLLLEAGGYDRSLWLKIPVGYYKTVGNPRFDWGYFSEPEIELGGRRLKYPRGRVLGGCGAINGLAYIRGHPADYDQWESLGNPGWGWHDVEPYFRRIERCLDGDSHYGREGPIAIRELTERREVCEAFIASAVRAGFRRVPDFNSSNPEGVGYLRVTVRNGWRSSTAADYLRPALRRQNLELIVNALTERIILQDCTATGVEYRRDGRLERAAARREVILCAGAINSPQILQLSGVGPGDLLSRLGIDVVRDAPAVGANLQDHFDVESIYRLRRPISLNSEMRNPLWRVRAASRWLLARDGPLTTSAAHVVAFARSRPEVDRPDLQFHFVPLSLDADRRPHPYPAVSLDVCQLNPKSRGSVVIKSSDAAMSPAISPSFLSAEEDRQTILAGLRLSRRIAAGGPFHDVIDEELAPGRNRHSDEDLLEYARATGGSIYHTVGTCRMGPEGNSVVDSKLKVKGVSQLRIADCSIVPQIISGNTNACAIVIAERAADLVREEGRMLQAA